MHLQDQTISDLKAKYGDELHQHTIRCDDQEFTFVTRPVTPGEWRRFKEASLDAAKRAVAVENLAKTTMVWADGAPSIDRKDVMDALDACLKIKPALADTIGGKVAESAALSAECETKKL